MTQKERVITTIKHGKPDRVAADYYGTSEATKNYIELLKLKDEIELIIHTYQKIKDEILIKLSQFKKTGIFLDKKKILQELCFCLLTPQSKAEMCWNCVKKIERFMDKKRLDQSKIEGLLHGIRFYKTKAKRIIEAKSKIEQIIRIISQENSPEDKREWLVENINGLGMKEATHFLRNIGKSGNLAILDRHILRKLKKIGMIKTFPSSLTRKKYLEIEKKMQQFSKKTGIPVSHLDFVFWYHETGRIFK